MAYQQQPQQLPPEPVDDGFEPYAGDQGYSPYEQQMPPFGQMGQSMPYPNQSAQLIQGLLNFRREVTTPLLHMWRGEEQDIDGNWIIPEDGLHPLMNEKGISYCISFILSFCNPVFITSNMSQEDMAWQMKMAGRAIINNVCAKYKEFGMNKLDIPRVVTEVLTKLHAIMLGSLSGGYRMWMSSTHHSQELVSSMPSNESKGGGLLGLRNFFTR